jgi:hypothetical protein
MTVHASRWPRVGGTILRAVVAPFALGSAVSMLAWAVNFSRHGVLPLGLGLDGPAFGAMVELTGMSIAGYFARAVSGRDHGWLGFVSAAAGATVPILWAMTQHNSMRT